MISENVSFLLAISKTLQLPFHSTTATALKSFAKDDAVASGLDAQLMVCTCIHLACKQTEVSRKLRDIVNAGYWYDFSCKYEELQRTTFKGFYIENHQMVSWIQMMISIGT
ncbi:hypothetical protein BDR26DRAFT_866353 [Obelidium mucronatum]|nr:hypothetical protein BDR26DRAFT_866353 [Obelidium mucronatum]